MTKLTQEILFSSNTQPENQAFPPNGDERLALLKQHFPNCFDKHGAFLPEKMAEILHSDGISTQKEGYSLNWLGKSYARVLKDTPPETLLAEDTAHNRQPENANSENLLIKGDNLEVLKHLKNAYKNQIKMIYIDPPYNTGSDGFVYQDDRKFTPEQLAQLGGMDLDEAKRVLEFTAKKSNSHSAWLTFMYPRLYVARELLHKDGVIFISIDDNEVAQLKILCDEVFGEENFVDIFSWVKTSTPPSLSTKSRKTNEYILCYEKNKDNQKYIGEDQDEGDEPLLNSGNTKRELVFPAETFTIKFMKEGVLEAGDYKKVTLINDIFIENYKATNDVRLIGEFKWTQDTLDEEISKGTSFIAKTEKLSIRFQRLEKGTKRPTNFIKDSIITPIINKKEQNVETNEGATKEIIELFVSEVFDYVKPTSLIQYLLNFKIDHNDIALDFFAGSGTTAHSVMKLNSEKKYENLKYICVQLPEDLDEALKKAAAENKKTLKNALNWLDKHNKPHNLFEITKARIELAAAKIRTENPDYSGDLGFKIFQTEPNFQAVLDVDFDPAQAEIPDSKNAMLSDEQLHTLLTTWRVHDGSRLPEKVQTIDLAGYTAYYCRHHLYLLASGFHSECVKALIEKLDNDKDFVPERIVLFSANMESAMQKELAQAVKTYANKKGLNNLSVLARV